MHVFLRRPLNSRRSPWTIPPTNTGREPAAIKSYLNNNQFRLYQLIWQRMVACQMAAAIFENTTADIKAKGKENYLLRSTCSLLTFPGFITLYSEGKDEDSEEEKEKKNTAINKLAKGDALDFINLLLRRFLRSCRCGPSPFASATPFRAA